MSTIVIENAPLSLEKKIGKKADVSKIIGLYWDGMDWCQYDEVLPDQDDIQASKNIEGELSDMEGKDFLSTLISK